MLSSGFMDWMKRASFILCIKLYLELAKTSGLVVLALCPGFSVRYCPTAVTQCEHFQQFNNRCNEKAHVSIIRWSHCVLCLF